MDALPNLANLDSKLREILIGLEESGRMIRDLDFNVSENVHRIAEAVSSVHQIQVDIYKMRPDLAPPSTKPDWGRD
jgi:hypothetical protein